MPNPNELMLEMAENMWDQFFSGKVREMLKSTVKFCRATVVSPENNGKITVQEPFDDPHTVPCAPTAAGLKAGDQCIVCMLGDAVNSIVIGSGTLRGVDCVVEYGSSNGWSWEKRASGRATCRGNFNTGVMTMTASGQSFISDPISVPFPAGLFVAAPSCIVQTAVSGGPISAKSTGATTKDTLSYQVVRTGNYTDAVYVAADCVGRWK